MVHVWAFPNCGRQMMHHIFQSFHSPSLEDWDMRKLWLVCSDYYDWDDYCQSDRRRNPTLFHTNWHGISFFEWTNWFALQPFCVWQLNIGLIPNSFIPINHFPNHPKGEKIKPIKIKLPELSFKKECSYRLVVLVEFEVIAT